MTRFAVPARRRCLTAARECKQDPFDAITAVIPWDRFRASVAESSALACSEEFDPYQLLREHYAGVRRWTPAFRATFTFQGVPAAASLLRAIGWLRGMKDVGPRLPNPLRPASFESGGRDMCCPAALSTAATI